MNAYRTTRSTGLNKASVDCFAFGTSQENYLHMANNLQQD